MRAKVPEPPSHAAHPASGFERLLAAEVELEARLSDAEQEARAILYAADQSVCERTQSLTQAVEAAVSERTAQLEREAAAERARLADEAARKVAAWDALTGERLERLVERLVAEIATLDGAGGPS